MTIDLTKIVKPLVWRQMRDGSGELHRVWSADCPLFEKTFWAEDERHIPKIEAKRVARITAALNPAAIREAALREAAYVAFNACLVPPDGGNPTEEERLVCDEASRRILALLDKKEG